MVRVQAAFLAAAFALVLSGCGSPVGEPAGPLTLTLFTSARAADEVVLEWTPDPRAERWQYRQRDYPWPWGEWQDIVGSNAGTTGHRVGGLLPRQVYRFQVRPWTADGPGEPSAYPEPFTEYEWRLGHEIVGKPETADGIVSAYMWAGLLEHGGTFRLHGGSPYTFTVPRTGLWLVNAFGHSDMVVRNVEPEDLFGVAIDGDTGRWVFDNPGGRPEIEEPDELAEQILASVRYEPVHPDPPLRALAGGGAGEVLLQWKSPPQAGAAQRWQYRHRQVVGSGGGAWSSVWMDIPGSDGSTRSYRVGGLRSKVVRHEFQVRPWLHSGPGDAYDTASIRLRVPGPNGIAMAGGVLEPGRTFLVDDYPIEITFETPEGMLLYAGYGRLRRDPDVDWVGTYDGLWRSLVLRDVASGSYLELNVTTGEYIERYLRPHPDGRDVGALFDQIIASTRRVPPEE